MLQPLRADDAAVSHHQRIAVRLLDGDWPNGWDAEGIVRGRDAVVVAELNGQTKGLLACRMVPLLHGLQVSPGMLEHRVVESLFAYMSGYVRASGFAEAVMIVRGDNQAMHRLLESEATVDRNVDVWTIGVG